MIIIICKMTNILDVDTPDLLSATNLSLGPVFLGLAMLTLILLPATETPVALALAVCRYHRYSVSCRWLCSHLSISPCPEHNESIKRGVAGQPDLFQWTILLEDLLKVSFSALFVDV